MQLNNFFPDFNVFFLFFSLDTRSLAGGDLFSQLHGVELQEQLEGARAEADQLRALQTAFCHKLRPLLAQLEVPVGDFDEGFDLKKKKIN
jgi:hypothetical protein